MHLTLFGSFSVDGETLCDDYQDGVVEEILTSRLISDQISGSIFGVGPFPQPLKMRGDGTHYPLFASSKTLPHPFPNVKHYSLSQRFDNDQSSLLSSANQPSMS